MAFSQEAENYAREFLEKRRQQAASLTERKRKEIAEKVPCFDEMERERRSIALLKARAALSGDAQTVKELSEGQKQIRQRLEKALACYGYTPADLEEQHICKKCGDTGLLPDGRRCGCFRSAMRDYLVGQLNASSPLSLSSFDTFRLDLYPAEPDPKTGIAPRTVMKANLEFCKKFVSTFPACGSILMSGSSGLGKTHLALAIASELLAKNFNVLYCSAAGVFARIDGEKSDFSRTSYTLESMKECDLLVLDDLGTEYLNNNVLASVYDLINSRISENRPTVITTNLTQYKLIAARYGEKISSRLYGCYKLMPFFGEDIRLKKNGF